MSKKIYICTSNSCQLHCKGCYMNSICGATQQVDLDYVRQIINNNLSEDIECVFHGGEPFFNRDDKIIQSYIDLVKEYPQIKWSATTNLVYKITPKLLELFELFYDKFLKTSWDVGDYRFKNEEQRSIWEDNIKFLLSKKFNVEVIVTVNKMTIDLESKTIIDYMKNIGVNIVNFERITENGRAKDANVRPTNRQTDEWLFKAFLYNKTSSSLFIPIFDEIESMFNGAEPIGCRKRECMKNVKTINSNNTLATCPNISEILIGDKDNYYEKQHKELIIKENNRRSECLVCKFYSICKGECCQLKFDETGCPGLLKIMNHLSEQKGN